MFRETDYKRCHAYRLVYPDICRSNNWHRECGYGTEKHMAIVWERIKGLWELAVVGDPQDNERWFSHEKAWRTFRSTAGGPFVHLLVLLYIGDKRKSWPNFSKSPLALYAAKSTKLAREDCDADDAAGAAFAEVAETEVAEAEGLDTDIASCRMTKTKPLHTKFEHLSLKFQF